MSTPAPRPTAEQWPIAAAMLPFPASQDAPTDTWVDHLAEVAYEGFTHVDLTDSWVQPGDLTPTRLEELGQATLGVRHDRETHAGRSHALEGGREIVGHAPPEVQPIVRGA